MQNSTKEIAKDMAIQVGKKLVKKKLFSGAMFKFSFPVIVFVLFIVFLMIIVMVFLALISGSSDVSYSSFAGIPSEIAIAEIPPELLPIFIDAGDKYEVSWTVLAAICKKESSYGTYPNGSVSSVGAVGIMQFMPKTWSGNSNPYQARDDKNWRPSGEDTISAFYSSINDSNLPYDIDAERIAKYGGNGVDGDGDGYADPYNPHDAIFSTAYMIAENIKAQEGSDYGVKLVAVLAHYSGGSKTYAEQILVQAKLYSPVDMPNDRPIWPLATNFTKITSHYGYRIHPIYKDRRFHYGIDIVGRNADVDGADIYAIFDGKLKGVYWSDQEGYIIQYENHAEDTIVSCCHIQSGSVVAKYGVPIKQGDVIAKVGNTGSLSTGSHLHIEVIHSGKHIDPLIYLERGLDLQVATKENESQTGSNY